MTAVQIFSQDKQIKSFKLMQQCFDIEAGTVVYAAQKHDYGLARDDTNDTGEYHVSVTLSPKGDYPFFTVAESNLQAINPTGGTTP